MWFRFKKIRHQCLLSGNKQSKEKKRENKKDHPKVLSYLWSTGAHRVQKKKPGKKLYKGLFLDASLGPLYGKALAPF